MRSPAYLFLALAPLAIAISLRSSSLESDVNPGIEPTTARFERVKSFEAELKDYKSKQAKATDLKKESPFSGDKVKKDLKKESSMPWPFAKKRGGMTYGNITYKFYVMNLDRRPERFQKFYENIRPQMLKDNTCRIASVDGTKDLSAEFAAGGRLEGRSSYPPNRGGGWSELNPGALGCFMSHSLAWDQIEKDDVDVGIILEDDAYMWSDTFDEDMKRVILDPANVNDKHVILMGHCEGGIGGNVGLARGGTACTTGMAVMKHAVPLLRQKMFPIYESIDSQLNLKLGYDYDSGFQLWRTQGKMLDQSHGDTDVQNYFHWNMIKKANPSESKEEQLRLFNEAQKQAETLKTARAAIPDCK